MRGRECNTLKVSFNFTCGWVRGRKMIRNEDVIHDLNLGNSFQERVVVARDA